MSTRPPERLDEHEALPRRPVSPWPAHSQPFGGVTGHCCAGLGRPPAPVVHSARPRGLFPERTAGRQWSRARDTWAAATASRPESRFACRRALAVSLYAGIYRAVASRAGLLDRGLFGFVSFPLHGLPVLHFAVDNAGLLLNGSCSSSQVLPSLLGFKSYICHAFSAALRAFSAYHNESPGRSQALTHIPSPPCRRHAPGSSSIISFPTITTSMWRHAKSPAVRRRPPSQLLLRVGHDLHDRQLHYPSRHLLPQRQRLLHHPDCALRYHPVQRHSAPRQPNPFCRHQGR
jgi:hypothetical protein